MACSRRFPNEQARRTGVTKGSAAAASAARSDIPPSAPARRHGSGRLLLGLGVLILFVGALAFGMWRHYEQQRQVGHTAEEQANFVPNVRVKGVAQRHGLVHVSLPGTTLAFEEANIFLITHYPQPSSHGTKQEHTAVSAGLNDGAQQGAISKGAQRGPVCCSLRNRGSVPGGGDALALAIRLCLPGLRRASITASSRPGRFTSVPPVDGRHR